MRWAGLGAVLLALILVPFVLLEARLEALAEELTQRGGWGAAVAIVALLALDVVLPIPSSVLSTAAGAWLGFAGGTAASWLGMMLASVTGYWLGARWAGVAGRWVGEESLASARGLVVRFGDWALVAARPVPVLAEASAVLAGLLRMPVGRFAALSAGANLGISLVYAYLGAYAMRRESFLGAFVGALVLPGLGMLAARRWRRDGERGRGR